MVAEKTIFGVYFWRIFDVYWYLYGVGVSSHLLIIKSPMLHCNRTLWIARWTQQHNYQVDCMFPLFSDIRSWSVRNKENSVVVCLSGDHFKRASCVWNVLYSSPWGCSVYVICFRTLIWLLTLLKLPFRSQII